MGKHGIKFGKIKGDVVVSKDQSGGITAHTVGKTDANQTKFKYWSWLGGCVAAVASIVTILSWLNIYPFTHKDSASSTLKKTTQKDSIIKVPLLINKQTIIKRKKSMSDQENKATPITFGDITGNVIVSQNQSGGITAHTVYVNKPLAREFNDDDAKAFAKIKKDYTVEVFSVGSNESVNYASQIVHFLQTNGYNVIRNHAGSFMPEPEPARYLLSFNENNKSVRILVPKEGV